MADDEYELFEDADCGDAASLLPFTWRQLVFMLAVAGLALGVVLLLVYSALRPDILPPANPMVFPVAPQARAWSFELEPPAQPAAEPVQTGGKIVLPGKPWHATYPATPSDFVLLQADGDNVVVDVRSFTKRGEFSTFPFARDPAGLSPDGRYVVQDRGNQLLVFATATGQEVRRISRVPGTQPGIPFTFVTAQRLLVADGTLLMIYDVDQGTVVQSLALNAVPLVRLGQHRSDAQACAVSRTGRYLAVLDNAKPPRLEVLDLEQGQTVGELPVPLQPGFACCVGIAFSHDGRQLACALNDSILVYDLPAGKLLKTIPCPASLVETRAVGEGLEWLPGDAGWLVSGQFVVDAKLEATLWRPQDNATRGIANRQVRRLHGAWHVLTVWGDGLQSAPLPRQDIEQTRQELAQAQAQRPKVIADLRAPKPAPAWQGPVEALPPAPDLQLPVRLRGPASNVARVLFSQGPQPQAIVLDHDHRLDDANKTIALFFRVYDLRAGTAGPRIALYDRKAGPWLLHELPVDVDPQGAILASVHPRGPNRIQVWSLAGKMLHSWAAHAEGDDVVQLFAINAKQVLTRSKQGKLIGWDIEKGVPMYQAALTQGSVALSPQRRILATSAGVGVDLFHAASGEFRGRLQLPFAVESPIDVLGFSADGTRLMAQVVATQPQRPRSFVAWDLDTGRVASLFPLDDAIQGAIWIGRDYLLDRTGKLYDLKAKTQLWIYRLPAACGPRMTAANPDPRCWLLESQHRRSPPFGESAGILSACVLPDPPALALSQKLQAIAGQEILIEKQPVKIAVEVEGLPVQFKDQEAAIRDRLQTALSVAANYRVAKEARFTVRLRAKLVPTGAKQAFVFRAGRKKVEIEGEIIEATVAILDADQTKLWEHPITVKVSLVPQSLTFKDPVDEVRYGLWYSLGEATLEVPWPRRIFRSANGSAGVPGQSVLIP